LPWSMCAMIEKLRILLWSMGYPRDRSWHAVFPCYSRNRGLGGVCVRTAVRRLGAQLHRPGCGFLSSVGLSYATRVDVEPIKMTLLENAYDFLNESLRAASRAESEPHAWKFAVLNVVQAIEVLLKARLQAEHPLLIYENVDKRSRTVSLSLAMRRIAEASRIPLTSRELRTVRKASQWRDQIIHFEFEMQPYQVEAVYSQLFEFATRFHNDHTDFGELHSKIERKLWAKEAELIEFFRREIVLYNGIEVSRAWPAEVMAAQTETIIELHETESARLRRGDDWPSRDGTFCHDCGIPDGLLHDFGCDVEPCPRCFGQLITCGCLWGEGPAAAELVPYEEALAEARRLYAEWDRE